MHASMHVRKLATALVALEYSLADYKSAAALIADSPELDQLDDLVAALEEANRELVAALANYGRGDTKDPVKFDS